MKKATNVKFVMVMILVVVLLFGCSPVSEQVSSASSESTSVTTTVFPLVEGVIFDGWHTGAWGNNTAEFEIIENDGSDDNQSLKVTVSDYHDGDAKWMANDIVLEPGKTYQVSIWYKTDIEPEVVIRYTYDDGTEWFKSLSKVLYSEQAKTTWVECKAMFVVPEDVKSMNVFMMIEENGWLMTDNYEVREFIPDSFERPLLTIMFDDGYLENVSTALPLLQEHGFKTTHCYMIDKLDSQEAIDGMLSISQNGHEIGCHSISHPDLTQLSRRELREEIQTSKEILEDYLGKPVDVFVSPFGSYNSFTLEKIAELYRSHRTVEEGYNYKNDFDIFATRVRNVNIDTTSQDIASWVEEAQEGGFWLILLYHRISDDPGPHGTFPNVFAEHLEAIADSGITVKTYSDALDEVVVQIEN